MIAGYPVNPGNDTGITATAVTSQHANRGNVGLLGDTPRGAHRRAGHMGAVAITIFGIRRVDRAPAEQETARADKVAAWRDAAGKIAVGGAQARVDHIDGDILTATVGVLITVIQGKQRLVYAIQSPGRVVLCGNGGHSAIWFNGQHPGQYAEQ